MKKTTMKTRVLFYIFITCVILYTMQIVYHTITKPSDQDTIPILGFHNIVKDEEKERYYPYDMWVDSEQAFMEKMQYLYDEGYETWSLDDLYEWKTGEKEKPEKVVVLTFDDGYFASSYLIAPILDQFHYQGTTFVIGGYVDNEEREWDGSHLQYLNHHDLQDQRIMKYVSHTYYLHYKEHGTFAMDLKTKEELQEDFRLQQEVTDTSYVAYPYGYYNDMMIEVLKDNNVKLAFGFNENRKVYRNDDNYTLPRFSVNSYTTMDSFKAMLESE